jgi:predicted homoserine dehydrogenase-like protein
MAKRVPVVGLGDIGMSHALAYTRIPGFEVVGVCERRVADRKLPLGSATMQAKSRTAGPASRRDCRGMLAAVVLISAFPSSWAGPLSEPL